jgi:hypothetical protein
MTDQLNPSNLNRAAWADPAVRSFCTETGCGYEDSLLYLLSDLMHWADARNFDFEAALVQATNHYLAELSAERGWRATEEPIAKVRERGA